MLMCVYDLCQLQKLAEPKEFSFEYIAHYSRVREGQLQTTSKE